MLTEQLTERNRTSNTPDKNKMTQNSKKNPDAMTNPNNNSKKHTEQLQLVRLASTDDLVSSIIDDNKTDNDERKNNEAIIMEIGESDAAPKEQQTGAGGIIIRSSIVNEKRKFKNLLSEEVGIRNSVMHSPGAQGKGGLIHVVGAAIVNLISAFLIFVLFLISLESLLSLALCISLTIYTYNIAKFDSTFDGNTMSWTLLTFAVVTPLSASIGMAFTRRESKFRMTCIYFICFFRQKYTILTLDSVLTFHPLFKLIIGALVQIADFRATMFNLLSAHTFWDWCKVGTIPSGRAASDVDWLLYTDDVLFAMIRICSELTRLLTLPNASRARHHVFPYGRKQKEEVAALSRKLHRSILDDLTFLTERCELLKNEGLPPNEATRIRQWERFLSTGIEQMLVIKKYRTPQALRSFARLFTVFLPPFYAPYYGQLAINLKSLGLGITFSILTSVALTSLFESMSQMEDPFVGSRLDCIDVESELRDEFLVILLDIRDRRFPDAHPFEMDLRIPKTKNGPVIRLMQAY
jgi:hypothetical protein